MLTPTSFNPVNKVHPVDTQKHLDELASKEDHELERVYTIWKKSSMNFDGSDGFSVFDNNSGKLVYRVDNYSRRCTSFTREIVLMDGDGNPLLFLRPKIMTMHDQWNVYEFEKSTERLNAKLFSIRKSSILQSSNHAEIQLAKTLDIVNNPNLVPDFTIQGCFNERSCTIWGCDGVEIARISRKIAGENSILLGNDVFNILIQPGFDPAMIIAFVVLGDRLFCS